MRGDVCPDCNGEHGKVTDVGPNVSIRIDCRRCYQLEQKRRFWVATITGYVILIVAGVIVFWLTGCSPRVTEQHGLTTPINEPHTVKCTTSVGTKLIEYHRRKR